jgi:hypothetical protein
MGVLGPDLALRARPFAVRPACSQRSDRSPVLD